MTAGDGPPAESKHDRLEPARYGGRVLIAPADAEVEEPAPGRRGPVLIAGEDAT